MNQQRAAVIKHINLVWAGKMEKNGYKLNKDKDKEKWNPNWQVHTINSKNDNVTKFNSIIVWFYSTY